MEPKFQTSFIPKAPVVSSSAVVAREKTGGATLLSILATLIFLTSILASAGLFFYKNLLTSQIASADKKLADARAAFEPEKIGELVAVNAKIRATKNLLNNHVVVSPILDLLGTLTVKNVTFSNFLYVAKDGAPTISMDVEARSYNALAKEQGIFSAVDFVKSSSYSNFTLADNGDVKAKFSATLDPNLTSYKKSVAGAVTSATTTAQ